MLTLILFIAGLIDLRYRKIPWFIILLLCFYAVLSSTISGMEKICGLVLTTLPLFLIAFITDKIKGGDLKFLAMLGMAVGTVELAWLLLFTTIYATVYTAVTKKKTIPLAFFAFLGWITKWIIFEFI